MKAAGGEALPSGTAWSGRLAAAGWFLVAVVGPLAFSPSAAATFFTAKSGPVYLGAALLALAGALALRHPAGGVPVAAGGVPVAAGARSAGGRSRGVVIETLAVAFLLLGLGSVVAASSPVTAVLGTYNQGTGWLYWLAALAAWGGLRLVPASPGPRRALVWAVLAAATIGAGLAVLQALEWEPLRFRIGFRQDGRAGSTLGNPLYAGMYLALATVVALDAAVRARSAVETVCAAAAAAMIIAGLAVTWSRGAWLALAVGVTVWSVLAFAGQTARGGESGEGADGSRAWRRSAWVLSGLVIWAVAAAAILAPMVAPARGVGDGSGNASAETSTVRTRALMWGIAVDAAVDRPVLGWGPNNHRFGAQQHMRAEKLELEPLTRDADAHSLPLEIAATWGVPASAVLAAWFVAAAVFVVRGRRSSWAPFTGGVLAAFVAGSATMPQNQALTPLALALVGAGWSWMSAARTPAEGEADPTAGPDSGRRAAGVRFIALLSSALLLLAAAGGSWVWYRADRHYLMGEVRRDLSELEAAAEGFPFVDVYWRALGAAEAREGGSSGRSFLLEEGAAHLERALSLSPRDLDSLTALTAVHLQRGEWRAAETAGSRAVSFAPMEPLPHAQLAFALLRLGDPARAALEAEAALAVDVRSARVLHTVGLYFREAGDVARARAAFEEALVVDPRFAPARQELGRLP